MRHTWSPANYQPGPNRWRAHEGPLTLVPGGRSGRPLVVTLTPEGQGAHLCDGGSVRRQLEAAADVLAPAIAAAGRSRDEVVLLAPATWLRLSGPTVAPAAGLGHGMFRVARRDEEVDELAQRVEALLGAALARLPVRAVVLGVARSAAATGPARGFDGLFVFDRHRCAITWAGAELSGSAAGEPAEPRASRHVAEVPLLGPCLVLNDLELLERRRERILARVRRRRLRFVLHAAYAAGSPGMWPEQLAALAARLPGVVGWASTTRSTAAEPLVPTLLGMVEGVDHLPITLRLGNDET